MVVRGIPTRLAKDAWWLDDEVPPNGLRAGPILLLALVIADLLVWDMRPGLGLALWVLVAGAAIHLTLYRTIERGKGLTAWAVLLLTTLPLIEVVQLGTGLVALVGLWMFCVMLAGPPGLWVGMWRSVMRLPGMSVVRTVQDLFAVRVPTPSKGRVTSALFDWALPVAAGAVFLLLFAAANPFVDQWLLALSRLNGIALPEMLRVVFWSLLAFTTWPLLRLPAMWPGLTRNKSTRLRTFRSGFLNVRSVQRALVVFNLIFLVQTVMDIGYLWGDAALPDGMTYAEYAHRGAYPLLATAILAGLFALMAQPYLGTGVWVRRLLYLWVAQTVLLVISSILRLELYVEVYGLTRLRFAAFVWMVLVALGLVLIIMQMVGRRSVGWFLQRAFALGFIAIYCCNLVNIDGLIARNNLANPRPGDVYLCDLGEGAVPAIHAYEIKTGELYCGSWRPYLSTRDDWREWGYRNARLHRSLAAMEDAQ